jgi:hypothetical protein
MLPFGMKLKRSVLFHSTYHELLECIIDIVKNNVKEYHLLQPDIELLCLCCNILENLMGVNTLGINKKQLILDVYSELFDITEADQIKIMRDVEFLFANGKIKKRAFFKRVGYYITELISNIFLASYPTDEIKTPPPPPANNTDVENPEVVIDK